MQQTYKKKNIVLPELAFPYYKNDFWTKQTNKKNAKVQVAFSYVQSLHVSLY